MSDLEKDLEEFGDELLKKWDPAEILRVLKQKLVTGEKLSADERIRYERVVGAFGDPDIITGPLADKLTRQHKAQALTAVVGDKEKKPVVLLRDDIAKGRHHDIRAKMVLAHELEHVRQAQEGVHAKADEPFGNITYAEQKAEAIEHAFWAYEEGQEGPVSKVTVDKEVDTILRAYAADLRRERLGKGA